MNGYDTDPVPQTRAEPTPAPAPQPAPDPVLSAPAETRDTVSRGAECLRSGYLSWPCV